MIKPDHPLLQLKALKARFWSHFGGHKTWRSRRSQKKTLDLLRQFAAVKIKFRYRMPLVERREKFDNVKFRRHSLKGHKLCFACCGPAAVRHHIISLNNGGDNSKRNLVSLCVTCHAEVHPWLKTG